jgi:hypothetical protein
MKVRCINANKSCFLKQGEVYEVSLLTLEEAEGYTILAGELTGLVFLQSRFEEEKSNELL